MAESGKVCATCGVWRAATEYNLRRAAPDGLQARCRSCSRAWYLQNRRQHMRNVRRRNDRIRVDNKALLREHLLAHPCVDCGERDLRVLEFDHLEGFEKLGNIGRFIVDALPWERVLEEIAKCEVCCANCHRIRTSVRANQWRHVEQLRISAAETAASEERLSRVMGAQAS